MPKSTKNVPYLPLFIDTIGRSALVVGGGHVAFRKVKMLLQHGLRITVVAPDICPEIADLAKTESILLYERAFEDTDAKDFFLVFAATDNAAVNARVEKAAQAAGALVNRSDSVQTQVMVPAVVHRGNLQIAVSTGGASPLLARNLRMQLEGEFDDSWEEYTELLADVRRLVIEKVDDAGARAKILTALCSTDIHQRVLQGQHISATSLYKELTQSLEEEIQ